MTKEKSNLSNIRLQTNNLNMDEELNNFLNLPRHRIINSLIIKYFSKDSNIADVGCGNSCTQLRHLQSLGYTNLSGIDFNINVSFLGIKLIQQDFDDNNSLLDKYDAIVLADVIEHLQDPESLLANIKNNLKDGGLLLMSVPNAGHFYNGLLLTFLPRHLNMSSAFGPWQHYRFFTYYDLLIIFKKLDLEIVDYKASAFEFRYMSMHWIKRFFMWLLNIPAIFLNFGPFKKYFSDHLYFVLKNK